MKFEYAVEIILYHEAGYVNDPRDMGGETNFGISKRAHPTVDIKNLTREGAIEIYRRDYWDANKIGDAPSCLRLLLFDGAINQGGKVTVGLLQAAIGATVDGDLGPKTLEKLASLGDLAPVIKKLVSFRWRRYTEARTYPVHSKGWAARLLDVSLESVIYEAKTAPIRIT